MEDALATPCSFYQNTAPTRRSLFST
jgi:hypothetical protein